MRDFHRQTTYWKSLLSCCYASLDIAILSQIHPWINSLIIEIEGGSYTAMRMDKIPKYTFQSISMIIFIFMCVYVYEYVYIFSLKHTHLKFYFLLLKNNTGMSNDNY